MAAGPAEGTPRWGWDNAAFGEIRPERTGHCADCP